MPPWAPDHDNCEHIGHPPRTSTHDKGIQWHFRQAFPSRGEQICGGNGRPMRRLSHLSHERAPPAVRGKSGREESSRFLQQMRQRNMSFATILSWIGRSSCGEMGEMDDYI